MEGPDKAGTATKEPQVSVFKGFGITTGPPSPSSPSDSFITSHLPPEHCQHSFEPWR
jgi:hypothetical protein